MGAPVVHECEGEYRHDSRKNLLEWNLTVIDSSNKTGVVRLGFVYIRAKAKETSLPDVSIENPI